MNRGGIRTIAWFATAALLLGACGTGDEEPTTPTAPIPTATISEPAPTETIAEPVTPAPTEAEPADPFAIPADPADIDKAYVERVLLALSASYTKGTRIAARAGRVTPEVRRVFGETHTSAARKSVLADFSAVLREDPSALSPNPRDPSISVRDLVDARRRCVFVLVRQNLGIVRGGGGTFLSYYYLVAANDSHSQLNPTDWLVAGAARPLPNGKKFKNPCR